MDSRVLPANLRDMHLDDTGFLFRSFFETIFRNRTLPLSATEYRRGCMRVFDAHLLSSWTKIIVASNPLDKEQIFGWIAASSDGKCVHFVYVREPYRYQYIATRLLAAAGIDTSQAITSSCWAPICEKISVSYRPWMLWRRE